MSSEDDKVILTITPFNFPLWWAWFMTQWYKFGDAQEELHEEVEKTLRDPDINDKFEDAEGDKHFRFDHNAEGRISAEGRKQFQRACDTKRLDGKQLKKSRADLITLALESMSKDSKTKMRSMSGYEAADMAISSFRIIECIKVL